MLLGALGEWMRDERGFSSSTVVQWRSKIRDFLLWYERNGRPFCALEPIDVDAYFVTEGARRWSRVSTSGIAAALRVFLRYMANCGECDPRLVDAIRGPRLYAQESLPSGPAWSDVQRILAHAVGDIRCSPESAAPITVKLCAKQRDS